jgi:alkanesulfonate monooxygenase SsuD/methylene tetrahydromethanopterin reductase-like flavin-dependent oxidoreductase (luciferase family)
LSELRLLLEEGAARSGRSLAGLDIAPSINVFVNDDLVLARNVMRPGLALYIGGMGSREQNFYNQLAQRYGFEAAAREVQDLYLDGKKAAACAAIPDGLIDLVSLCGPRELVHERIAVFRDAGVGSLLITPMAITVEDRVAQVRVAAELAAA